MAIKRTDNIKEWCERWDTHMDLDDPAENYLDGICYDFYEGDNVVGGFCLYREELDGKLLPFISGWGLRKRLKNVIISIDYAIRSFNGELFIKTKKRNVRILCHRFGDLVKQDGEFSYFKIRE